MPSSTPPRICLSTNRRSSSTALESRSFSRACRSWSCQVWARPSPVRSKWRYFIDSMVPSMSMRPSRSSGCAGRICMACHRCAKSCDIITRGDTLRREESRMPSIDMPLEQLRQYKPSLYREGDFESFWETTSAEAVRQPLNAELIPYDLPAKGIICYAVRFDGFKGPAQQGGRLAGWYLRPDARGKFPGVCVYHGYSGRGTRPLDMLALAAQGMCVLSMDCRGQNGQSQGAAVDPDGHPLGWRTRGLR